VTAGGVEQQLEQTTEALAGGGEAGAEILGEVRGLERAEADAGRLPVERTGSLGEELGHHPPVRAREDVARGVTVELDAAPEQTVYGGADPQDVLELVEDDDRPAPRALEDPQRQIEEIEQCSLVGRGVTRRRGDRHARPRRREGRAQPADQAPQPVADGS